MHLALAYIGDGFRLQRPFDQNLLKTAMQQWLPTLDATPDQWPNVMSAALTHVARTLDDPTGRWLLEPHRHGQFEWAVTTVINSTAKRFVIDRLFVGDDTWWIVDFKTSSPASEISHRPVSQPEESHRYRGQLVQYKTILDTLVKEQPEYFCGASNLNTR